MQGILISLIFAIIPATADPNSKAPATIAPETTVTQTTAPLARDTNPAPAPAKTKISETTPRDATPPVAPPETNSTEAGSTQDVKSEKKYLGLSIGQLVIALATLALGVLTFIVLYKQGKLDGILKRLQIEEHQQRKREQATPAQEPITPTPPKNPDRISLGKLPVTTPPDEAVIQPKRILSAKPVVQPELIHVPKPSPPLLPQVFISYVINDDDSRKRFHTQLKVGEKNKYFTLHDDRAIDDMPYTEIVTVMETASVVIFLISADYLASDFVNDSEVPFLCERNKNDSLLFVPVIVNHCAYDVAHWLKQHKVFCKEIPLKSLMPKRKQDKKITDIVRHVVETICNIDGQKRK
ncbi:MAG TPA: TIR domain-containing protein [Phycisphaerales bacterium]|nr:TIR domain-containing protein [Phycisphaerales bacterium]